MKERLFELLDDERNVLVVPTERAARHLLVSYARERKCGIGADHVLSFDTFSSLFREDTGKKTPCAQISRFIFSSLFLRDKADRLCYLYNPSFPSSGERFVSFLSSILPSLGNSSVFFSDDRLYRDVMLIKESYESFMERHSLYEDSWLERSAGLFRGDRNRTYWLVNPEAEVNMMRLLDAAGSAPFIKKVSVAEASVHPHIKLYESEKGELAALFDALEALRDDGVAMEDIILSSPEVSRLRPYLEREAARRGIPLSFERDEGLLETKVGGYLESIREIRATAFSFSSLERLFMNNSLPWRDEIKALNRDLLSTMVDLSVSDDRDGSLLSRLSGCGKKELADHYRKFRSAVRGASSASDGAKLASSLQALATYLFGPEQFRPDEKDRDVYSFIMDKLDAFSSLAAECCLKTDSLFSVFMNSLAGMAYVSQKRDEGIRVMAYTHDYDMYVRYRFLFALSDDNCRIQSTDCDFLEDCEVSGRHVYDAGNALLNAYSVSAENVVFSSSRQTYSGRSSVPFFFVKRAAVDETAYSGGTGFSKMEIMSMRSGKRFLPQGKEKLFSGILRYPCPLPAKGLSYSSVSTYAICPFRSAMSVIFSLEDKAFSPSDFDVRRAGSLLHECVESFLRSHEGEYLQHELLPSYEAEIEKLFEKQLADSPFDSYTRDYLKANYLGGLVRFPSRLMEKGDGAVRPYRVEEAVSTQSLNGRIDAIVYSGDDMILIDFKTRSTPSSKRYQLLMYRMMVNEREGHECVAASDLYYYKIADGTFENEIRTSSRSRTADEVIAEMNADIEAARNGYREGIWQCAEDYDNCQGCAFRSVCRRRFALQ